MKISSDEIALRRLLMEFTRNDLTVLRRVCSHVGGTNPDGPRAVTDKFIQLIDARDATIAADAAALTVQNPSVVIVFAG